MLKIKRFLEYRKCTYCGLEFLTYEVDKINKTDEKIANVTARFLGEYVEQ